MLSSSSSSICIGWGGVLERFLDGFLDGVIEGLLEGFLDGVNEGFLDGVIEGVFDLPRSTNTGVGKSVDLFDEPLDGDDP